MLSSSSRGKPTRYMWPSICRHRQVANSWIQVGYGTDHGRSASSNCTANHNSSLFNGNSRILKWRNWTSMYRTRRWRKFQRWETYRIEVGCCDWWIAERTHWWTDRWLEAAQSSWSCSCTVIVVVVVVEGHWSCSCSCSCSCSSSSRVVVE